MSWLLELRTGPPMASAVLALSTAAAFGLTLGRTYWQIFLLVFVR
jgi:hypothetical protein